MAEKKGRHFSDTLWGELREQGDEVLRERILALRKEGFTEPQIANELGVCRATLRRWCNENSLRRYEGYEFPERSDTLCWECKKATGYCSWSHCLEPVEGWTAIKANSPRYNGEKLRNKPSYIVIDCPEFEEG